ncbi:MAG: cell division protein ZapE [Pseudomonadota bacterium]
MDFRARYLTELDARGFTADEAQLAAVETLAERTNCLLQSAPSGLFGRLLGRHKARTRGVYLWGGVGRGKTFVMDLFFEHLEIEAKYRAHFHRFMRFIHDQLGTLDGEEDPLDQIAEQFASEHRVLCLDEFFVSDITDAMILARLLEGLFTRGLMLVTTSNAAPTDLYRDGLQRARFLPAIALLEKHCEVVNLDAGTDYRLQLLASARTYLDANEPRTGAQLALYFERLAPGRYTEGEALEIEGRPIGTVRRAKSVVWFTFGQLCDGPRSQNDYISIARRFQTVILSDVPVLDAEHDDQARRFIAVVDEFYDRRVKLVLSAAAAPEDLYTGQRLAFEFERTHSRLVEMQSEAYLAQPHRC